MKPLHVFFAFVVAVAWGFNFIAIRFGLQDLPPLLLAGVRFIVSGLPALWIARPPIAWRHLIVLALLLFVIQFAMLFIGMDTGMPTGLASVLIQTQALFTPVLAAVFLHEKTGRQQNIGLAIGIAGIATLMTQVGFDGTTWEGMLLTLAAPISLSAGNILLRRTSVDALALMIWLSVISAPIFLVISFVFEGFDRDVQALEHVHWFTVAAIAYIAIGATLVGYGLWGHLLKLYPANTVVPFSLLVPVFAAVPANLIFGEQFGTVRLIGMGLILLSVAIIAIRLPRKSPRAA